jgi:hypothetical protein
MDDAVMTVDAEVGAHLEQPSTPRTTSSLSIAESCKEHLKPMDYMSPMVAKNS